MQIIHIDGEGYISHLAVTYHPFHTYVRNEAAIDIPTNTTESSTILSIAWVWGTCTTMIKEATNLFSCLMRDDVVEEDH